MKRKSLCLCSMMLLFFLSSLSANTLKKAPSREFYQLLVYQIKDKAQETRLDKFLSEAYLPALHRAGIQNVGVFKTLNIDTATAKKVYVFMPFKSLTAFLKTSKLLETDKTVADKGADYLNAAYNDAPYIRIESILMEAFAQAPLMKKPTFDTPKSERIYELRSYESATEKLYRNKVAMFDKEEVEIFERIGSKPVFYGEVIAGSRMPNLMYLTTYRNMDSRTEQWKKFSDDPKWKRVSALPEYQHNVIKNDTKFLVPADYSDF